MCGVCLEVCDTPQLVDDKALAVMMRDSCEAARLRRVGALGGDSINQNADGVRKFQMGSVPDRGGRKSFQKLEFL
jgi:hypothetical protein